MASIFTEEAWTHEDGDGNRYSVVDHEFVVTSTFRSMDGDKFAKSERVEKRLSTGERLITLDEWRYQIASSGVIITKREAS